MPYILKKGVEAFEVVDGPLAGRKYKPGIQYTEVPPQEEHRFEPVSSTKSPPRAAVNAGAASSAKIIKALAKKSDARPTEKEENDEIV